MSRSVVPERLAHSRLPTRIVNLRLHDLLVRRFRHSLLPGGVADLETVPAGIEKIELPSGEITLGTVFQLDDWNFLFVKGLASLHETFGAYREGMMHALFDDRFILRLLPLAQEDIMIADIEAGHYVVAQAPDG